MRTRTTFVNVAGFVVICLVWGTTLFVIKIGLRAGWPPFWFASLRFLIASVIMSSLLVSRSAGPPLGAAGLRLVLPVGVVGVGVHYGLVFWGERFIGAGVASLVAATQPATTVILDALLTGRGVRIRTISGLIVGAVGIVLIVGAASLHGISAMLGAVAVFAGVTAFAASTVYSVHRLEGLSLGRVILTENIVGGVLLGLVALPVEGVPRIPGSAAAWTAMLYLAAVASIVGLVGALWLARRIGARRFSMTAYVTPLIGAAASIVWLGESFRWPVLVGGALLIVALLLILRDRDSALVPEAATI